MPIEAPQGDGAEAMQSVEAPLPDHHASAPARTLRDRLDACVTKIFGTDSSIQSFAPMADGHAGLTFGVRAAAAGGDARDYILKLGPAGVRRSGSTDIYRQAPLLDALKTSGVQVPAVYFASPEDELLGAPFIVMERLPGRTFIVWEPDTAFLDHAEWIETLWRQSAEALAALHRFDWEDPLRDWEAPVSLEAELARWAALLKHCEDPQWLARATRLHDCLRRTLPARTSIGLVHGDFQPGNLLYEGRELRGIVDWDLAMLGPQGIDVGWLMMMADRDAWAESWRPVAPLDPARMLAIYIAAGGPAADDPAWYQAFAHFRMAAIGGLNLKLHRSGRRIDDTWERFALSIPSLLDRGIELVRPLVISRDPS